MTSFPFILQEFHQTTPADPLWDTNRSSRTTRAHLPPQEGTAAGTAYWVPTNTDRREWRTMTSRTKIIETTTMTSEKKTTLLVWMTSYEQKNCDLWTHVVACRHRSLSAIRHVTSIWDEMPRQFLPEPTRGPSTLRTKVSELRIRPLTPDPDLLIHFSQDRRHCPATRGTRFCQEWAPDSTRLVRLCRHKRQQAVYSNRRSVDDRSVQRIAPSFSHCNRLGDVTNAYFTDDPIRSGCHDNYEAITGGRSVWMELCWRFWSQVCFLRIVNCDNTLFACRLLACRHK